MAPTKTMKTFWSKAAKRNMTAEFTFFLHFAEVFALMLKKSPKSRRAIAKGSGTRVETWKFIFAKNVKLALTTGAGQWVKSESGHAPCILMLMKALRETERFTNYKVDSLFGGNREKLAHVLAGDLVMNVFVEMVGKEKRKMN